MAELKTKATRASVTSFLQAITPPQKRKDARLLAKLCREVSGKRPRMWGDSIVGYGSYHYKYDSGREGDFFRLGFSPRKHNLTVYLMPGYTDFGPLLKKLGKHKIGKSCLYIKQLEDINLETLHKMMQVAWKKMQQLYPA